MGNFNNDGMTPSNSMAAWVMRQSENTERQNPYTNVYGSMAGSFNSPHRADQPASARLSITARGHYRRKVRAFAAALGVEVREFPGWWESDFVVTGDTNSLARLREALAAI